MSADESAFVLVEPATEPTVIYYVRDPRMSRHDSGNIFGVSREQANAVIAAGGEAHRKTYRPAPAELVAYLTRDRAAAAAAKLREIAAEIESGRVASFEAYWAAGDEEVRATVKVGKGATEEGR